MSNLGNYSDAQRHRCNTRCRKCGDALDIADTFSPYSACFGSEESPSPSARCI